MDIEEATDRYTFYLLSWVCCCYIKYLSCNLAKKFIKWAGLSQEEPTKIFIENKSAIALAMNPIFPDQNKNIDVHYISYRSALRERMYKQSMSNHRIK